MTGVLCEEKWSEHVPVGWFKNLSEARRHSTWMLTTHFVLETMANLATKLLRMLVAWHVWKFYNVAEGWPDRKGGPMFRYISYIRLSTFRNFGMVQRKIDEEVRRLAWNLAHRPWTVDNREEWDKKVRFSGNLLNTNKTCHRGESTKDGISECSLIEIKSLWDRGACTQGKLFPVSMWRNVRNSSFWP